MILKSCPSFFLYYHYLIPFRVFHTSVIEWFSVGVWLRASLLKSPIFFSAFWPVLIMVSGGWSLLILFFLSPPVPLSILWRLHRVFKLQFLSPSLSIVFHFSSRVLVHIYLFTFFQFHSTVSRNGKVHCSVGSLFSLTIWSFGWYYSFGSFFTPALAYDFSLEFGWEQIYSKTFLSNLADLKNSSVWMVYTCPLISKSSVPFTKHLGIVPNSPTTADISVTFMIHSFSRKV